MQVQMQYVQQRGNSLFFRMMVPFDLKNHFGGRSEITQSLRIRDPFTAYGRREASLCNPVIKDFHFNRQVFLVAHIERWL